MPRGKNKKKQFSKRPARPSDKTREVNPFELKVNRQKHEVLGRKISKTDKGKPGVSRSKAVKKVHLAYNFLSCIFVLLCMVSKINFFCTVVHCFCIIEYCDLGSSLYRIVQLFCVMLQSWFSLPDFVLDFVFC